MVLNQGNIELTQEDMARAGAPVGNVDKEIAIAGIKIRIGRAGINRGDPVSETSLKSEFALSATTVGSASL